MKILKEFKEFAIKGNVFDMAIGIIIGTAFSKVVNSLVNDILMPPLGFIINKMQFQNLSFTLQEMKQDEAGNIINEMVAVHYGHFVQIMINFIIITLTIFTVIKLFNRLKIKSEDVQNHAVPTPKDIELLSEIRDLLREQKK